MSETAREKHERIKAEIDNAANVQAETTGDTATQGTAPDAAPKAPRKPRTPKS